MLVDGWFFKLPMDSILNSSLKILLPKPFFEVGQAKELKVESSIITPAFSLASADCSISAMFPIGVIVRLVCAFVLVRPNRSW